jgi:RNA-directed DNA polymerase
MAEMPSSETVSTKQQRIAQLARQAPQMAFTSLNHYIDLSWLQEAYDRTRKDGAVGVDGMTAAEYERDLRGNLQGLLNRAKSGTYVAPPVRRVHIPKGTGKDTRPIGIPTLEDKVLQRAVVMVLEPIYEQDFLNGSYGFRPKRSAHQALESLWKQRMGFGGGWILEVDIRKFFDTLDHAHLRELLQLRVRDGAILRLIGKWLNAGVMEDGAISHPDAGTPQGGVISPLLANVYLHQVLDVWFERTVKACLKGRAFLIRYADDFVIGFTDENDAKRVLEVLPKRFGKYGLTLHPDKTRLVEFRPPQDPGTGQGTGTFDLLGFTHSWERSRKGRWVVKRKTAKSRFTRAMKAISQWCRMNRHESIGQQCRTLGQKLRGHFGYYGITGNAEALWRFKYEVHRLWRKWLSRRKRGDPMTWVTFNRLLARYPLPAAVVVHSVYRRAAKP